jgi:hypothetical protein
MEAIGSGHRHAHYAWCVQRDYYAGHIESERWKYYCGISLRRKPEDYNIAIPSLVKEHIAKEIQVKVEANMQVYSN